METHQLRKQGLAFARSLQRAYEIVTLYTHHHPLAEEPIRSAYMALSPLLLESSELILGFAGHRVMLNELSVFDTTLSMLENEFRRRGITGVRFRQGISLDQFRQGLDILAKSAESWTRMDRSADQSEEKTVEKLDILTNNSSSNSQPAHNPEERTAEYRDETR